MTINGKYYSEPEAAAYIMQLESAVRRYESENRNLTDKLDEIGKAYNEQVSLAGWLEEQNKELGELADIMYNDMIIGSKKGRCAICKRNESTGLIGKCRQCFNFSEWVWRYADKYLREPDEIPEKCKGDQNKCDYYKNSDQ